MRGGPSLGRSVLPRYRGSVQPPGPGAPWAGGAVGSGVCIPPPNPFGIPQAVGGQRFPKSWQEWGLEVSGAGLPALPSLCAGCTGQPAEVMQGLAEEPIPSSCIPQAGGFPLGTAGSRALGCCAVNVGVSVNVSHLPWWLQWVTAEGFNAMGDQTSMEGPGCKLGVQDVMDDRGGLGWTE